MSAVVTENQQDLPLVVTYMHQDSADCAVVHTMEHPSDDAPYHYLGYKYFVKKSPTNAVVVKHRDSLYLEYCGMTTSRTGERLGSTSCSPWNSRSSRTGAATTPSALCRARETATGRRATGSARSSCWATWTCPA